MLTTNGEKYHSGASAGNGHRGACGHVMRHPAKTRYPAKNRMAEPLRMARYPRYPAKNELFRIDGIVG